MIYLRFIIPNGKMIFQSLDCETGALGSVVVSGGESSLIYEISNKGVITNEIYDTIHSKQDHLIKIADSEWYIKELKYCYNKYDNLSRILEKCKDK